MVFRLHAVLAKGEAPVAANEVGLYLDQAGFDAFRSMFNENSFEDLQRLSHIQLRDHIHPAIYRTQQAKMASNDVLLFPLTESEEK